MTDVHVVVDNFFRKDDDFDDDELTIVGETEDAMLVSTDGSYYFLTDGETVHSNAFLDLEMDPTRQGYSYIISIGESTREIIIPSKAVDFNSIREIRAENELEEK